MRYSLEWAADLPEAAAARLARAFRGVEITADDVRSFRVSAVESGDASVALTDLMWEGSGHGWTDANDFLVVADVYHGSVALKAGGQALDTTRVALISAPTIEASWHAAHCMRTVRIRRSIVEDYARGIVGTPLLTLEFSSSSPISAVHERLWRAAERHARENVAGSAELLHDDLIWNATVRNLVGTLLTVFPNSVLNRLDATDGARTLPSTIRRAIAYMNDNIEKPLRTADIAVAAGLSSRGLQSAFRRVLDQTPTEHLRLLRLEGARNDLLHAPGEGASVAQIAHRWGFAHVPRFAAAYRARYGENPRETLHPNTAPR